MKQINGLRVLERHDFERFCPSFYAGAPKVGVSDKYHFLNTRSIALQLWEMGWMPVYARESRSINPENRGFTKHIVRWAHKDLALNGERIELVGTNSHNRACAFSFMAGIFRLVCSNGMVVKTADFGAFSIKHIGADVGEQVAAAVSGIGGYAAKLAGNMNEMKAIEMTPNEQGVFASAVHEYLYDEPEKAPVRAEHLLLPRRATDSANRRYSPSGYYTDTVRPKPDLWTTFNVIQENVMKGGLKGYNRNTRRRVTTRQIKSIDKDVKLNTALWSMAEKMAEIKKAA